MTEHAPKLRLLVREVRKAQKFKDVALNHLEEARAIGNSEAIVAARQVVEFASEQVTKTTHHLLDCSGYDSLDSLSRDIDSIVDTSSSNSTARNHYLRGQKEVLESILAYAEDELGEL